MYSVGAVRYECFEEKFTSVFNIPGRSAYIGLGFGDRSDSFDLNVALQDHFKWLRKEQEGEQAGPPQQLDLGFKDGETIKINMKITVSVLHTLCACLPLYHYHHFLMTIIFL